MMFFWDRATTSRNDFKNGQEAGRLPGGMQLVDKLRTCSFGSIRTCDPSQKSSERIERPCSTHTYFLQFFNSTALKHQLQCFRASNDGLLKTVPHPFLGS